MRRGSSVVDGEEVGMVKGVVSLLFVSCIEGFRGFFGPIIRIVP